MAVNELAGVVVEFWLGGELLGRVYMITQPPPGEAVFLLVGSVVYWKGWVVSRHTLDNSSVLDGGRHVD